MIFDTILFDLDDTIHDRNRSLCRFVGDNPLIDIKGAIDSSLIPIWLSHGQVWTIKNYMPKYIINNIFELMQI